VLAAPLTPLRSVVAAAVALAALAGSAPFAAAGSSWNGIRSEVFGTRPIEDGAGLVTIKAPYRPDDVRAVPVSIEARLPDGRTVRKVTLIVDENPSPVAAAFTLGGERNRLSLGTKVRLNQESFIRAVVEDSSGRLSMVSTLVKFAGGQSACSAPPTGDPQEIAANMGKMKLASAPGSTVASSRDHRVKLDIRHPNHTGMALDQMTLLYIPLRMVSALEVRQGAERVFEMSGSITLSENPSFEFDFPAGGADKLEVTLKDSDGAAWTRALEIAPQS
jgi:sulfur-oxidizing protein SoxY